MPFSEYNRKYLYQDDTNIERESIRAIALQVRLRYDDNSPFFAYKMHARYGFLLLLLKKHDDVLCKMYWRIIAEDSCQS